MNVISSIPIHETQFTYLIRKDSTWYLNKHYCISNFTSAALNRMVEWWRLRLQEVDLCFNSTKDLQFEFQIVRWKFVHLRIFITKENIPDIFLGLWTWPFGQQEWYHIIMRAIPFGEKTWPSVRIFSNDFEFKVLYNLNRSDIHSYRVSDIWFEAVRRLTIVSNKFWNGFDR